MRPGDFPIGSPESRATARLQLTQRNANRKRLRFVSNVFRPGADNSRVDFAGWQECPNGTLFQMVYVPHVWLRPGESVPTCPDCGAPFKKTREYPGMVGFKASCMDEHDTEPLGPPAHKLAAERLPGSEESTRKSLTSHGAPEG